MSEDRILLLSRLFKLLNDANRLKIIFAIGKDGRPVSEIMQATELPQTLVSFHLRPLRESGILVTERKGAFIYYRLADAHLIDLLASLAGTPLNEENRDAPNAFIFPPMRFMRQWMKGGD